MEARQSILLVVALLSISNVFAQKGCVSVKLLEAILKSPFKIRNPGIILQQSVSKFCGKKIMKTLHKANSAVKLLNLPENGIVSENQDNFRSPIILISHKKVQNVLDKIVKFNFATTHPFLLLTNEKVSHKTSFKINQKVYIVDMTSLVMTEMYQINGETIESTGIQSSFKELKKLLSRSIN